MPNSQEMVAPSVLVKRMLAAVSKKPNCAMIQTQEEFILNPPNEALKRLVTWCPGLVAHGSAVFTRWLLRHHAHLHPPSGEGGAARRILLGELSSASPERGMCHFHLAGTHHMATHKLTGVCKTIILFVFLERKGE